MTPRLTLCPSPFTCPELSLVGCQLNSECGDILEAAMTRNRGIAHLHLKGNTRYVASQLLCPSLARPSGWPCHRLTVCAFYRQDSIRAAQASAGDGAGEQHGAADGAATGGPQARQQQYPQGGAGPQRCFAFSPLLSFYHLFLSLPNDPLSDRFFYFLFFFFPFPRPSRRCLPLTHLPLLRPIMLRRALALPLACALRATVAHAAAQAAGQRAAPTRATAAVAHGRACARSQRPSRRGSPPLLPSRLRVATVDRAFPATADRAQQAKRERKAKGGTSRR